LGLLIVGIIIGANWFGNMPHSASIAVSQPVDTAATKPASASAGQLLLALNQVPGAVNSTPPAALPTGPRHPIVISDGFVVSVDKEEVPSLRDGHLLIIGTEVEHGKEGEVPPGLLYEAVVSFVGYEMKPNEAV